MSKALKGLIILSVFIAILIINPGDFLGPVSQFIKANAVVSVFVFLNLLGGILRFYFNISSFAELVKKSKEESSKVNKQLLKPLFQGIFLILKFVLSSIVFLFIKSPYKHWVRLPVYILLITLVVLQFKNYQYNKDRYRISIVYDSYAEDCKIPELIKKRIDENLADKDFKYQCEMVPLAAKGIEWKKYDLILSAIMDRQGMMYSIVNVSNNHALFIDLMNRESAFIKNKYPLPNTYFVQYTPGEMEGLNLIAANLKKSEAAFLTYEGIDIFHDSTMPQNIIPIETSFSERIQSLPKVNAYVLMDESFARVLYQNGLNEKKIYLLNPSNYYDSTYAMNYKTINIVPFEDSIVIAKFKRINDKRFTEYISLIKFYMIDFLDFLCIELNKSKKTGFAIKNLYNKEYNGTAGKMMFNADLVNVYGRFYLYDIAKGCFVK